MANLSNINNKFLVSDAGHVSIGATTTTYPLTVESGGVGTVLRAGTAFVSIDSVGTAASPSLIFNGDDNTGIFRAAADTLAFSTAGTERMSIDSSGSLIVGTATVAAANAAADNFVIKGEGTAVGLTISQDSNSGTGTIFFGDAASSSVAGFRYNHNTGDMAVSFEDDMTFSNNGGERMRIDSSGNVLINSGVYLSWGTNGASSIEGSTVSNKLQFRTNSTDAMIIDSSQRVGIGTTSPAVSLQVETAAGPGIALSNSGTPSNGSSRGDLAWFNNAVSTTALIRSAAVTDNVGSDLRFYTRPAAGSLTETMRIDSTGKVIINDNTIGDKLLLAGDNAGTARG